MKANIFGRTVLGKIVFGIACLATLLALFYAEENWRGRRAFLRSRQAIEAKGDSLELQAYVPPPIPDDQNLALTSLFEGLLDYERKPTGVVWLKTNNAARLARLSGITSAPVKTKSRRDENLEKNQLMDLRSWQEYFLANTNVPHAAKSQEPAEDILMALSAFEPEMRELRQAAATHPLARFPVHFEENFACLLPHLAKIKSLVQYLKIHAVACLELGRTPEAYEDLRLIYQLTDGIKDEPYLITHLVRIACLASAIQTVKEGIVRHQWNADQLLWIQERSGRADLLLAGQRALKGERALCIEGIDQVRRGAMPANVFDAGGDESPSVLMGPFVARFLPSGWFYQNMATVARFHEEYLLTTIDVHLRRVYPERAAAVDPALKQRQTTPYNILAKLVVPALENSTAKTARWQTALDHAVIACALERCHQAQKAYPESLDLLMPQFAEKLPRDLITGEPYKYRRRDGDDYLLYSVGWNGKDDGGSVAQAGSSKGVEDKKGDWVWSLTPTEPVRLKD